jgi:hypothetical protein
MPFQPVQLAMRRLAVVTIVLALAFPLIYATATSTLFLQFGVERSTWILHNLPGLNHIFECAADRRDNPFAENYFSGFIQVSVILSTFAGLAAFLLGAIGTSIGVPNPPSSIAYYKAFALFLIVGVLAVLDIQHGATATLVVCGHDRFVWRIYPFLPALAVAYICVSAIMFFSIGGIVSKVLHATMELVRGR